MARLGRPGMSDEMKADLWRRWRAGESISVISRQIGKPPGSVFTVLKHHGGIAPEPRKARVGSLTMGEREEISRGLCAGESYRAIAGLLGRAVSTISREVSNNGGRDVYRAIAAQERALDRARRPKQCLLARRPALRQTVLTLLKEEWSPEQIVGHLRLHHGDDPALEISHETIYRSVYTTRWKVVPRELCKRLRTGRPIRKNKRHTVKGQWRSQITDARPIEERPQAAGDRSEFGHLEGDLVIGSNNSQVATLVDRKSRFLTVVKLASRHTTVVVPALAETYERMVRRGRGMHGRRRRARPRGRRCASTAAMYRSRTSTNARRSMTDVGITIAVSSATGGERHASFMLCPDTVRVRATSSSYAAPTSGASKRTHASCQVSLDWISRSCSDRRTRSSAAASARRRRTA
ncbi:IS30 family transposase [Streptomyces sp. GLT-R25]